MRSLSEIETAVKRASKAVGFSWGVSEEIGKSIRLLELFGLQGIKNLNLRGGYFSHKGPDSNLENKINGISAGAGINFGFTDFDFGVTRSNNYNQNRLFSRGLTDKYSIDKNILSFYASFTIKI